ncbi:MAG TPA: NosD domain-containing protein, partial [Methanothrix sp.]|nr:NosD domain-containing protein [Methanothrix sp.]
MRRILSALILAALYIASAEAATITVGLEGCDYTSIQRAVEEADPGDTISVESGTYKENVIVDKSLVLRGKGSGDDRPVVDGNGVGSTVTLSADRITFEGLIVKNAGYGKAGIEVRSDKNYIRNNLVTANRWYGISISGSDENVISSNVVSANKHEVTHGSLCLVGFAAGREFSHERLCACEHIRAIHLWERSLRNLDPLRRQNRAKRVADQRHHPAVERQSLV